jgi:hypothetical protein
VATVPERSRAVGIELLLRGSRGRRFEWWLAYSWSRAEDRIAARESPRQLDQPHTVVLDLNYALPKAWNLNLAWRYHSGWPTTPVATVAIEDPEDPEAEPVLAAVFGPLRSERLTDYHRLDLRASRSWRIRSGLLTFFVDVQNVYNRRNLSGFDLAIDDEEGVIGLDNEYWPGTFPSFGISWQFD